MTITIGSKRKRGALCSKGNIPASSSGYKAYCGFGYLVPDDPLDTMPPGVREAIESNQWHGLYFRGIDLAVSWSRRDGG